MPTSRLLIEQESEETPRTSSSRRRQPRCSNSGFRTKTSLNNNHPLEEASKFLEEVEAEEERQSEAEEVWATVEVVDEEDVVASLE